MDVISSRSGSGLNPNAPLFVPWAYRAVEDFSEQWWDLVKSSPWFRDYWLQECFQDPETFDNELDLPDMDDFFFDSYKEEEEKGVRDLVSLGSVKWQKPRFHVEPRKYMDKVPKIVNVKVSPRPIQQPR